MTLAIDHLPQVNSSTDGPQELVLNGERVDQNFAIHTDHFFDVELFLEHDFKVLENVIETQHGVGIMNHVLIVCGDATDQSNKQSFPPTHDPLGDPIFAPFHTPLPRSPVRI